MFAEFLKDYRMKNGLTQAELASKLSVSQNTVSQYESGKRNPPVASFFAIAEAMGVEVSELVRK